MSNLPARPDQYIEQRYASENGLARISNLVPQGIDGARMVQSFLSHIRGNSKLMNCSMDSLGEALLNCCRWGVFPGPDDHVSIIPRGGTAVAQLSYKGKMHIVYRDTPVSFIKAVIFYDQEVESGRFIVSEGLEQSLKHQPLPPSMRGEPAGAYAVATYETGERVFSLMWKDEIEKIRDTSAGGGRYKNGPKTGPWVEWAGEMWKKTAIIRLCKNLSGGKLEQVAGFERRQAPNWTFTGSVLDAPTVATVTEDGEVIDG